MLKIRISDVWGWLQNLYWKLYNVSTNDYEKLSQNIINKSGLPIDYALKIDILKHELLPKTVFYIPLLPSAKDSGPQKQGGGVRKQRGFKNDSADNVLR